MRSCSGHAFVEALFVLPLFLMMVLGFIDLTRWELDRLALWRDARFCVRRLSMEPAGTPASFQRKLTGLLTRFSRADVIGHVSLVPVLANIEKSALRRKKRLDVLRVTLKAPARALTPLFKIIHQISPLNMTVTAYEAYAPAE